ncbi:MAG: DUF1109 domain-containing protein [Betaproteobacteria bacterium]|nr:DUF1109 domain-containing protein [Betaproteobacteria bacterium]
MKTDDFVELLARDTGPVQADMGTRRFALAIGVGALCAALLMVGVLGLNPALAAYTRLPNFWAKVVFVTTLAGISLLVARRLARPGVGLGRLPIALAVPVLAMWAGGILVLVTSTPAERVEAFFGQTWKVCPFLIAMLSAPVFVGVVWAMKGLAPTRLRLAGGAAGFLSGAVGAVVYCLHCPELGLPFVGCWYLLGILIPTGIGALLGERLLRW